MHFIVVFCIDLHAVVVKFEVNKTKFLPHQSSIYLTENSVKIAIL